MSVKYNHPTLADKKQFEETDEYQHDRPQQHMATTTDTTQSVQCYYIMFMWDFGATPCLSERAFRVSSFLLPHFEAHVKISISIAPRILGGFQCAEV